MPIFPIVGSKFHPPAKTILSILPHGQELELIPEPENQFDPNAIAVWIDGENITTLKSLDEVESLFLGSGFNLEKITNQSWHLGYIPKELAATIHLDGPVRGRLCFGANGGAKVEFNL